MSQELLNHTNKAAKSEQAAVVKAWNLADKLAVRLATSRRANKGDHVHSFREVTSWTIHILIIGAQYYIIFYCKTHSDKEKLERFLLLELLSYSIRIWN